MHGTKGRNCCGLYGCASLLTGFTLPLLGPPFPGPFVPLYFRLLLRATSRLFHDPTLASTHSMNSAIVVLSVGRGEQFVRCQGAECNNVVSISW